MNSYTPIKAIRKNCIECCGGSTKEVTNCTCYNCSLFPYRLGKNPSRKGMGNPLAFAKRARVQSAASLSASVANVNASVALTKINSSTQLMDENEK